MRSVVRSTAGLIQQCHSLLFVLSSCFKMMLLFGLSERSHQSIARARGTEGRADGSEWLEMDLPRLRKIMEKGVDAER